MYLSQEDLAKIVACIIVQIHTNILWSFFIIIITPTFMNGLFCHNEWHKLSNMSGLSMDWWPLVRQRNEIQCEFWIVMLKIDVVFYERIVVDFTETLLGSFYFSAKKHILFRS